MGKKLLAFGFWLLALSSWLGALPNRFKLRAKSQEPKAFSLLFRRQRQPEDGYHALARDVGRGLPRRGQVERLAMFAAIDLSLRSPGFFSIAAGLLDYVLAVEPALQMAAAEFSFFVLLVAGALPCLLDLDLMVGELRNILRARSGYFASRQGRTPRSSGPNAAGFGLTRSL